MINRKKSPAFNSIKNDEILSIPITKTKRNFKRFSLKKKTKINSAKPIHDPYFVIFIKKQQSRQFKFPSFNFKDLNTKKKKSYTDAFL